MFFLAIVLLGFVSLRELSVDLLPDISSPRLTVVTKCDGVAAVEIENLVTSPLEAAVSTIPGLRRVESVSKEGLSCLIIDFGWETDMDFALLHTREKLDNARYILPGEAERPTIVPLDPQSKPIMILAVSGQRSLLELKEFSEELIKPRLEQIEGIGSAEISGGVEREIQVEINPQLLALYGLAINQIAQRIDAFNRNLQGGSIKKGRFKYALRIVGEFDHLDEIREISLKTTRDRGIIKLKDVAQVNDSISERMGMTKLNSQESVGVLVRKEAGANTVKVTHRAREVLESIREENPQVGIVVVFEQAKYIENAILSVWKAIIFGGILAFLVLFIFLQEFRTPVIIAVVIPVSLLATFSLLYFRNITLNIMSLGGLALGVGMLVDNSVVVSESIFRHLSQGKDLFNAAYTGTKEVGMAVTASTLTTISVFLPVIYIHGGAGQLFKDQALTVTFALLSSLLVSLTLLPMFSSRKFELRREKKEILVKDKKIRTGQKKEKKTILRYCTCPYLGLRWLLYFVIKIVYLVFNFFLSFVLQLFLLLIHDLSILFRPIVRIVFKGFNLGYQKFASIYHMFLWWSLENKGRVMIGSLAFLGFTFFLSTHIRRELMPQPETASFELSCKTPVDYSLEQTADVVSIIEKWLKEEGVKICFSQIGLVSGLESLNADVSLNSARIYAEFRSSSELKEAIENLRRKIKNLPEMDYAIVREQSTLAQFLAFQSAELGLKIKGDDLDKLKNLSEQLVTKLRDIEGIADLSTNIGEGKPELLITIKKETLERYANISPAAIGDVLVDMVRGKIAAQFKETDKNTIYWYAWRMQKGSILILF